MDEPSKIRPFPNDASRATVRELLERVERQRPTDQPPKVQKLGLYPLGNEDVIISLPLYHLIVAVLTRGTPGDQQKVAEMMQSAYVAPFP